MILIRAEKTAAQLAIPVLPELEAAILASPTGNLSLIATASGKPMVKEGFRKLVQGCLHGRWRSVKRTRTSTPVKELAPQASASTSSAMTALSLQTGGAKRRRSSNKSLQPRQASARSGSVAGLAHAQDGEKADDGGGGDVIADPGDAAGRLENLGQRRRKRGAENAAEIIGAGRAGIAHFGREQFRQQRAERREGQAHRAKRKREEDQNPARPVRQREPASGARSQRR